MTLNSDQIKNQVEFYFSNSNYRTDKFLRTTCESNDGWIDISTILKFKKLSSNDISIDQFIQALSDSNVVEIKDNKIKKVIDENYYNYLKEDLDSKIVGISNFNPKMKFEEIEFFLKKHCTPKLIRMRTDKKKKFNGQVLLEVASIDEAEYLLTTEIAFNYDELVDELKNNSEPKRIKKENQPLKIMKKAELLELNKKKEDIKSLPDFKDRIYSYETENDLKIKEFKEIIPNIAFVDLEGKKIRFKEPNSFEEKEFEKENIFIKIKKMSEQETEEYIKSLKLNDKGKGKRKERKK